jgi:hypothetical protein
MTRQIKSTVLHCSESPWADALEIDAWHANRGFLWDGYVIGGKRAICRRHVGYHVIILNDRPFAGGERYPLFDGQIQPGRPFEAEGAHCPGRNESSIGVCLVGNGTYTPMQLASLWEVQHHLAGKYNYGVDKIEGHCEVQPIGADGVPRLCPRLPMDKIREWLLRPAGTTTSEIQWMLDEVEKFRTAKPG